MNILIVSVMLMLAVSSSKCNPTTSLETENVKPLYTSFLAMDLETCLEIPNHFKQLLKSIQSCSKQIRAIVLVILKKVDYCQHNKDPNDITNCLIELLRNLVIIAEQHKVFDKLIELNTEVIMILTKIMKCCSKDIFNETSTSKELRGILKINRFEQTDEKPNQITLKHLDSMPYGTRIEGCAKIPRQVLYVFKLFRVLSFELRLLFDANKKKLADCIYEKNLSCLIELINTCYESADRFGVLNTMVDIGINVFLLWEYIGQCLL
ncbi:hypothetical protein WDU94_015212 [Cyamophila willieti]